MEELPFKNVKIKLYINEFKCETCNRAFKTNRGLVNHRKVHDSLLIHFYDCAICSRRFTKKFHLNEHMREHGFGELNKSLPCPYCGAGFSAVGYMYRHILREHESGRSKYECHYCGIAYMDKISLDNHISNTHLPKKIFIDLTDMATPSANIIDLIEDDKHSCPECGVAFKSLIVFNMHIKLHAESII